MTILGLNLDSKCNYQICTNWNRVIFDPIFLSVNKAISFLLSSTVYMEFSWIMKLKTPKNVLMS